jgi:hypothetical protein
VVRQRRSPASCSAWATRSRAQPHRTTLKPAERRAKRIEDRRHLPRLRLLPRTRQPAWSPTTPTPGRSPAPPACPTRSALRADPPPLHQGRPSASRTAAGLGPARLGTPDTAA